MFCGRIFYIPQGHWRVQCLIHFSSLSLEIACLHIVSTRPELLWVFCISVWKLMHFSRVHWIQYYFLLAISGYVCWKHIICLVCSEWCFQMAWLSSTDATTGSRTRRQRRKDVMREVWALTGVYVNLFWPQLAPGFQIGRFGWEIWLKSKSHYGQKHFMFCDWCSMQIELRSTEIQSNHFTSSHV